MTPDRGFAPANPHEGTRFGESVENCTQCHVFRRTEQSLTNSDFEGLRTGSFRGDRLYPGAPPIIPHSTLMRENCLACHSGPAARPEIICSHPDRRNCVQCHVRQRTDAGPLP
jgi:cytochrome c-type protein NapB